MLHLTPLRTQPSAASVTRHLSRAIGVLLLDTLRLAGAATLLYVLGVLLGLFR